MQLLSIWNNTFFRTKLFNSYYLIFKFTQNFKICICICKKKEGNIFKSEIFICNLTLVTKYCETKTVTKIIYYWKLKFQIKKPQKLFSINLNYDIFFFI